ncbi:MAG: 1-acyl-sn-glycerol-3-phosphate acyltransferase [Hyalangium sp.]|uniref:1-acyl-sn-glycerol-3-phosphate acyltransferase n=1 Tax=Hyalangium sp. TaxID=2028555 RepID=UPI00389A3D23
MAKGVLGNDPFQRGAAQRPTEAPTSEAQQPQEAPASKKAKPAGGKSGKAAKKATPSKSSGKAEKTVSMHSLERAKTAKTPAAETAKTVQTPKVTKAPKPTKGRKGRGPTEEEAHRLREPAAPETPRKRPPARVPVVGGTPEAALPQTPKEQEVDRVLATAVASEATEAAVEVAAEVAVETVMALHNQQSGTGAPPGSLDETWNRELATAVVAEAAEAAAEAVLDAALAAGTPSSGEKKEAQSFEERTAIAAAFEEEADEEEADEDEEPFTAFSAEVTVIDRAYALEAREGLEAAQAQEESEDEQPDTADDEYPPGRQPPISLIPPTSDRESPKEPFFTEQVQGEQEPTAPPSVGMFSLAKEIALQALASASVGKALGTAHGLLDALRAGLGTSGSTSLDEYGRDSELVGGLQPLLDFLYERYWRVSVQGADQLPSGGVILVANHSGALPYDGLVASLAILRERPELREPRWLVEDQIFHAPVLGTLFNRLGAVRACPENALRLLDEQRPVLVFPEGYQGLSKPFAQRYQLKRFGRGGFVKLALRTGAPIIPVAIVGSEETSPLLGRIPASFLGVPYVPLTSPMPLPARWTLRFGEPIGMEELGSDAADDLAEVHRLTERTRESIQGMLQALLRERRSVFAG